MTNSRDTTAQLARLSDEALEKMLWKARRWFVRTFAAAIVGLVVTIWSPWKWQLGATVVLVTAPALALLGIMVHALIEERDRRASQ